MTGAFGGGEQGQPPHPDSIALATLLLAAGADPNDNQALYNRMFDPCDDHLELLLAHGLGTAVDSPWRRALADSPAHEFPTPQAMINEQLRWAAGHHQPDRVRLLLDSGIDPDGLGYHPNFGDATAYQLALAAGDPEITAMLAAAGADTTR
ncbi:hypothetical protein ACQBAR_05885 [Propionibacteriaceae bacterium Y1685]|uniref:hypothetical protein n=1 Tax=Microlunatus sp. Y1700 TaxID=3418487 RepID=UPI003B7EF21E